MAPNWIYILIPMFVFLLVISKEIKYNEEVEKNTCVEKISSLMKVKPRPPPK